MPDWGLGEVMAVPGDGKLRVHFEVGGERLLKNAPLTPATGEDLTRALPKPRGSGSGRPARSPKHKSFDEYRQVFLERFPAGFEDPTYLGEEREYKLQASQALSEELSASALGALVSDGSFEEVAQRVLAVVGRTKLMFPQEAIALKKGLEDPAARETLSRLLLDLLYGSDPYAQRFGAFCSHLEAIKAARWPVATYFPFLADPAQHMFLKPMATQRMAAACEVELNYRATPNVLTYESLLRVAERLRERLADLGTRDGIDIQSFIWCAAQ
jgi:hypothetical protein